MMKRILEMSLGVMLALGLTAVEGLAQSGTTIGVRGGVSVASASFSDETLDAENRIGIVGGPFVNFDFGTLGFQIAGLYNSKGVETTGGTLDVDYIELPAVLKIGIPLGVIKPSVFGGAALAFRTSCELDGVACSDDAFKSGDVVGVVGADLAIYLGGFSLWADARYGIGLNEINDASTVFGDLKNRNWNLTAGVGVRL